MALLSPPSYPRHMGQHPVSEEIGACLGAFFRGGSGPSHGALTRTFDRTGYGAVAPYSFNAGFAQMNKEERVRAVVREAIRHPARSREVVDGLLAELRAHGSFSVDDATRKEDIKA